MLSLSGEDLFCCLSVSGDDRAESKSDTVGKKERSNDQLDVSLCANVRKV